MFMESLATCAWNTHAEAISEAALRPTMRYVEPKSGEQQARSILFRIRE